MPLLESRKVDCWRYRHFDVVDQNIPFSGTRYRKWVSFKNDKRMEGEQWEVQKDSYIHPDGTES